MSITKLDARQRVKRSNLTGVTPTCREGDFTDGTWLNTEIRTGEFFYNVADERLWIGTNTVPLELSTTASSTLAGVLALGNTTGGSDIIVSTGDLIRDSGYNALLGLGSVYTALYYKDTNATPNESILQYSPDNSTVDIDGEQYSVALINRRNTGGATQHFNGLYIGNMTYDLHSPTLGLGLTGALLVTTDSLINASAINSAIIGGNGSIINASISNSIILGGTSITAAASNTVYVPDLNIQTGKSILSSNGDGLISLDYAGVAGDILISTDGATLAEKYIWMSDVIPGKAVPTILIKNVAGDIALEVSNDIKIDATQDIQVIGNTIGLYNQSSDYAIDITSSGVSVSDDDYGDVTVAFANSKVILNQGVPLDLHTSGSNEVAGKATLVAGTVTVNTNKVNSSDIILVTRHVAAGTLGELYIGTIVNGTSFDISSSNVLETSVISWVIIKTH